MNLSKFLSSRIAILVALLCVFACAASADTVYSVSGSFLASSSSNPDTGPLNGGTFSGSFSATLPLTSGNLPISTFDISLFAPSSTTPLVTFSNTTPGDSGQLTVLASNCATGPSTLGPCDAFLFSSSAPDYLQLLTPLGFTGGSVYPGFSITAGFPSFGGVGGFRAADSSFVASGSISPVAEPGSLLLFGTGLLGVGMLAGWWSKRKRVLGLTREG